MNKDIRISTTIGGNLKIRKLRAELGSAGFEAWVILLCSVGVHRASGVLAGWTDGDVEMMADWSGAPGALVETLSRDDINLIHRSEDGDWVITGWLKHNSWAAKAQERSARAKELADLRWEKERSTKASPSKGAATKRPAKKRRAERRQVSAEEPSRIGLEDSAAPTRAPSTAPAGEGGSIHAIATQMAAEWNRVAPERYLAPIHRVTGKRKKQIATRLKEDGWDFGLLIAYLEKMVPTRAQVEAGEARMHFVSGGGRPQKGSNSPFKIDFDWLLENDTNLIKVIEGKYDNNRPSPPPAQADGSGLSERTERGMTAYEEGMAYIESLE